ncbi:MAG: ATP-dependent zinc protease [Halochromatium sp.]|uniref:ATP-dependent zinc protease family protein n=1 Tax=Halochromatium sp. TaxID=2049430 RepID=UPI003978CEE5
MDAVPVTLGWREWVGLPELGLPLIKAKVDTGARTSALHAFEVACVTKDDADWVRFAVHPLQYRDDLVMRCAAPLLDRRAVTDSGGHCEERFVIATTLALGTQRWPIELTLTDRDSMRFRMLIGRTALAGRALVDVRRSFLMGQHADAAAVYLDAAASLDAGEGVSLDACTGESVGGSDDP